MVELKRPGVTVVAAESACTACLGQEDFLEPPSPAGDACRAASCAAVAPETTHATKRAPTMDAALAKDLVRLETATPRVPSRLRLECEAPKPVSNRGRAQTAASGYLTYRKAQFDERAKVVLFDPTSRDVARPMLRHQAVLVHPVRHCRRVLPDLSRDRLNRPSRSELGPEPLFVHYTNTSSYPGRTTLSEATSHCITRKREDGSPGPRTGGRASSRRRVSLAVRARWRCGAGRTCRKRARGCAAGRTTGPRLSPGANRRDPRPTDALGGSRVSTQAWRSRKRKARTRDPSRARSSRPAAARAA